MFFMNNEPMSIITAGGTEHIPFILWAVCISPVPFIMHLIIWWNMMFNPTKISAKKFVIANMDKRPVGSYDQATYDRIKQSLDVNSMGNSEIMWIVYLFFGIFEEIMRWSINVQISTVVAEGYTTEGQ